MAGKIHKAVKSILRLDGKKNHNNSSLSLPCRAHVRLCGVITILGFAIILGSVSTSAESNTIIIHADEVIADVNPLLFGQNFGPWMTTSAEFIDIYKEVGVTLLRFPAGNWGDEYDIYPNNLDELAMVADELEAEVVVQTRSWRKGTPEKAAELVRYVNVENDYGFRYWEVGNEPDLYEGRAGNRKGDPTFDIDWYNAQFMEFAAAMKVVDPEVKVVGSGVTGGWREWIPAFLQANGDIVDVISWHWYPNGHEMSDKAALTTASDIGGQVKTIRAWWQDPQINPKGYQRPVPPLFLGEYSITWASGVKHPLASQVNALWVAEVIGRAADLGVEMGAHFSLMGSPGGTRWHGLVDQRKDLRPVYSVFQLYSGWGTTQVRAESPDEALLPVFASLREDGSLAIMVINKDPDSDRQITIELEGFRPDKQAQVWQKTQDNPEAVQLPNIETSKAFSYTFPVYSITLLILNPNPTPWFVWVGLALVAIVVIAVFWSIKNPQDSGPEKYRGRKLS